MGKSIGRGGLNRVAVLVVLAIAAYAGMVLWASSQRQLTNGPQVLLATRSGEGLVTAQADGIVVLDGRGGVARYPSAELGVEGRITALAWHGDEALLVGDSGRRTVLKCRLGTGRCLPFFQGSEGLGGVVLSPFKMAFNERLGWLVVADTERHRLLLYSSEGSLLGTSEGRGFTLHHPNTVEWLGDDTVVVADTGRERVVAIGVNEEGFGEERWSFPTGGAAGVPGRSRPNAVAAGAGGEWWVLKVDPLLLNGEDLVRFSLRGEEPLLVELGEEADPVTLTRLGDYMVLGGYGVPALYAVDGNGRLVRGFEQRMAGGVFRELRLERLRLQWMKRVGWLGISVAAALMMLVAYLDSLSRAEERERGDRRVGEIRPPERVRRESGIDRSPSLLDGDGVHWFEKEVGEIRTLKRVVVPAAGLLLVMLVAVFFLLPGLPPFVILSLFGFLGILGLVYWALGTMERERLGVIDDSLVLVDYRGRRRVGGRAELIHDGRYLVLGSTAVTLRLGTGESLYSLDELSNHLNPLLAGIEKSSGWTMQRALMASGHPSAAMNGAAVLLLLSMLIAYQW